MSDNKEREAFEAHVKTMEGYPFAGAFLNLMWKAWQARAALQAGGQPVAWHIGNADGSMSKLGAIYHDRKSAVRHIDSYGGELEACIVPLYAAPAPVGEPAALTDEFRKALIAAIVEHTDSSEIWAEGIITQALLAAQPAAEAPTCETCNGTRMVDDGEITGSGGIEFENGPIKCVKDCPDCAEPAAPARADCEHTWIENKGYPLSDNAAEVCSKCWTGRGEDALSPRAESVARALLADRQGVALSEEVWGIRIGDSDRWAYTNSESDADFWGKQSGLKYEKRRYVRSVVADKDMREAFEEALPFIGGTIHVFSPTRTARDERYLEGITEVCWRTWQAAMSRASSSRAEAQAVPGWEAPYVIDHTHANQAYVTLGFSSEAECKRFIKATRCGSPNISAAEAPNAGATDADA